MNNAHKKVLNNQQLVTESLEKIKSEIAFIEKETGTEITIFYYSLDKDNLPEIEMAFSDIKPARLNA